MKALFCKQARLAAHPMTYAFVFFGCMLLIPNYPYTVAFFYVTLGIFFMYQKTREMRDADFSALLPVRKRDTVLAGILFSLLLELASLVIAVPFAFLSVKLSAGNGNAAGLDPNLSLFAFGFLLFSVFNLIFFPSFYKNGYKVGFSFLKAAAGVFAVVLCDVILPYIPPFAWIDGTDYLRQLPLLAAGILIFALSTVFVCKRSAALYEKVDL